MFRGTENLSQKAKEDGGGKQLGNVLRVPDCQVYSWCLVASPAARHVSSTSVFWCGTQASADRPVAFCGAVLVLTRTLIFLISVCLQYRVSASLLGLVYYIAHLHSFHFSSKFPSHLQKV